MYSHSNQSHVRSLSFSGFANGSTLHPVQTVLSAQNRADFVALELELGYNKNRHNVEPRRKRRIEPWCFPVTIMGIFVLLIIFLPFTNTDRGAEAARNRVSPLCDTNCRFELVESIPRHLKFPDSAPKFGTIFSAWDRMIKSAKSSIDIASFYWDLRQNDTLYSGPSHEGERILKELVRAGTQRKIKIRIAQSQPSAAFPDIDSAFLSALGAAEVRSLNFNHLMGSGVLHTKFWVIDGGKSFWIGSANMDWRSLTEVKELGLAATNCSCLGEDLSKIFAAYWYLGASNTTVVPDKWPANYSTSFNATNPFLIPYNGDQNNYPIYLSSSPPKFCPAGRTGDLDALLSVMKSAKKFVYIAVMDYTPVFQEGSKKTYWPAIDQVIRETVFSRNVTVRLLVSKWNHTNPTMINHLRSLLALNGVLKGKIEIRWFEVPAFTPAEHEIPFARVNHNKYMVTDSTAFIGTSNWEGSYFTTTAGVSIIIGDSGNTSSTSVQGNELPANSPTIRDQLESVFLRDWDSKYATDC